MKKIVFIIMMSFLANFSFAQEWTNQEFETANTARDVENLTSEEKEVIRYINLARLYPKKFAQVEIVKTNSDFEITNDQYLKSLVSTLKRMKPVDALYFDESMYQLAKCFAEESGASGYVGHYRKTCKKGYDAECCSYGGERGRQIVLQLLIDKGVPSLGHRNICLDKYMESIGTNIHSHSKYNFCCVLDFKRKEINYTVNNKSRTSSFYSKVTDVFK